MLLLRRTARPLRLGRPPAASFRSYSDAAPLKGRIFIDAFPVSRLGYWDIRHYINVAWEEPTLEALRARLSNIKAHAFKVVDIQPYYKDGGVFVTFEYTASDPEDALETIITNLNEQATKLDGGVLSWRGGAARAWLVKGSPWIEDMRRFPTGIVNIAFEGPDIGEERLYHLLRPYGPIHDITPPTAVPAGTLRSANIFFDRLRSATLARNTLHGLEVSTPGAASTKLHLSHSLPFQPHKMRDWLGNHPKIVLPILISIFGGLVMTIFDPIRSLMIQGKMEDMFDIREYRLYQWLRTKSVELRIYTPAPDGSSNLTEVWKEREQAEKELRAYFTDWPAGTIAFVHGPQGSGKTRLLDTVLADSQRSVLTIDCRLLQNTASDGQLLTNLARQVGYWPVFSFLNSANHAIDLISVGLIGQKANLSSSLPDQVRDMLSVVRNALCKVHGSHQRDVERRLRRAEARAQIDAAAAEHLERIRNGTWHDGRLDCVCGNGPISELGVGDERFGDAPAVTHQDAENKQAEQQQTEEQESKKKRKGKAELEAVGSLPIVVIRNFDSRGSNNEEIFDVIAEWTAGLVEQQLAHVVVITDNRENAKRLAKALPSKPLKTIALSDADEASALAFVKRKLKDADIDLQFTREQISSVQRLGGRASDLESLVHKVKNGATVDEAVEDLISRGVSELRKNAFGDDSEDAKNLQWTREEAWSLLKLLSKQPEVPYHEVLLEFPFKGDEASLRNMEHAELIAIGTHNGMCLQLEARYQVINFSHFALQQRPSSIRPGKPVFKYVFERLVNDPIFQATQDIAFNEKVIAGAENTIKACEQELLSLKEIGANSERWWSRSTASGSRSRYLLSKMQAATTKIETLERRNGELRKILAKGG